MQQPPDDLIVGRCSRHREIGAENVDKCPHPIRREFFAFDVRREHRAIGELPRPMQNLLTRVLNPRGCPCNRNGQLVPARFELGLPRRLPHLRHDIREFFIGRRKRQRALCLDFENRGRAVGVRGLNDHIVKRTARPSLLEFDSTGGRARQTARFTAGKQRQKIKRADLALELRSCVTGRCWRCDLRRSPRILGHAASCSRFVRDATASGGAG